MEMKHRILLTIILGLVLVSSFYLITDAITKYTGYSVSPVIKDDFSTCLNEKDVTLYIQSADSTKTLSKIKAFDYLENVNIINCAGNNQPCLDNQISTFPTWRIDQNKINNDISVVELSRNSGCKLV